MKNGLVILMERGDGILMICCIVRMIYRHFIEADSQIWYRHGKCHRDNNLPAIIWVYGAQLWYRDGQRHRENDLPAIAMRNGHQSWWIDPMVSVIARMVRQSFIKLASHQEWWINDTRINVKKWIKDNNLPSWESWDDVTWSLFRLEFL